MSVAQLVVGSIALQRVVLPSLRERVFGLVSAAVQVNVVVPPSPKFVPCEEVREAEGLSASKVIVRVLVVFSMLALSVMVTF